MIQLRLPPGWVVGPLVFAALGAGGAGPARAAVKLSPGQELVYSGTVEMKVNNSATGSEAISGPVKVTAVVDSADPAKGYGAITLRSFQQEARAGQPRPRADIDLTTLHFGSDLARTGTTEGASGPVSAVVAALGLPLTPRAELKSGDEWRQSEALPALPPRPVELVYSVAGMTKVGDRTCTQIRKKLAQPLPFRADLGGATLQVTDYGQTLCVDPETGQIVSSRLHEAADMTAGQQHVQLRVTASATLQQIHQLSEAELFRRTKAAAVIDQVKQTLRSLQPGGNNKPILSTAAQEIASFRKQYPDSPYAPVMARLDEARTQIQAQIEKEVRLAGLKGAPAPRFSLKALGGAEKTLAAYRGKIILLNFFANW